MSALSGSPLPAVLMMSLLLASPSDALASKEYCFPDGTCFGLTKCEHTFETYHLLVDGKDVKCSTGRMVTENHLCPDFVEVCSMHEGAKALEKFIGEDCAGLKECDELLADSLLDSFQRGKFVPHMAQAIEGKYLALVKCEPSFEAMSLLQQHRALETLSIMEVHIQTAQQAVQFLADDCVDVLEQNARVSAVGGVRGRGAREVPPLPWGLDLIDGKTDGTYTRAFNGSGVDVYVLDTGVDATHSQFGGRVKVEEGKTWFGRDTHDVYGHGTHCAGTIAGEHVGVAPGVAVIPMKVLGDDGYGDTWGIIGALDFILQEKQRRGADGRPMVVSASIGGPFSSVENAVWKELVDAGVVAVVAAGNDNIPASEETPASAEGVITVGALDAWEYPAWWSNHGSGVDIWAPGVDVLSAVPQNEFARLDGTSMACPHVAGLVALLLEAHPDWSPDDVKTHLYSECTVDSGVLREGSTGLKLRTFAAYGSDSRCAASGSAYPLPALDPETPAEPTEDYSEAEWVLDEGPCSLDDEKRCLRSPHFPRDYESHERCRAHLEGSSATVSTKHFDTEENFDFLIIEYWIYSGDHDLQNVPLREKVPVFWDADEDIVASGWELCIDIPTGQSLSQSQGRRATQIRRLHM